MCSKGVIEYVRGLTELGKTLHLLRIIANFFHQSVLSIEDFFPSKYKKDSVPQLFFLSVRNQRIPCKDDALSHLDRISLIYRHCHFNYEIG
jgi:Ran GTPase-activating protein (RanGAP) involved in mRNA processing and transport